MCPASLQSKERHQQRQRKACFGRVTPDNAFAGRNRLVEGTWVRRDKGQMFHQQVDQHGWERILWCQAVPDGQRTSSDLFAQVRDIGAMCGKIHQTGYESAVVFGNEEGHCQLTRTRHHGNVERPCPRAILSAVPYAFPPLICRTGGPHCPHHLDSRSILPRRQVKEEHLTCFQVVKGLENGLLNVILVRLGQNDLGDPRWTFDTGVLAHFFSRAETGVSNVGMDRIRAAIISVFRSCFPEPDDMSMARRISIFNMSRHRESNSLSMSAAPIDSMPIAEVSCRIVSRRSHQVSREEGREGRKERNGGENNVCPQRRYIYEGPRDTSVQK